MILNPKYDKTQLYKVALRIAVSKLILNTNEEHYQSLRNRIMNEAKEYIDKMKLRKIDRD